jgi:hypothetical protein
VGAIDEFERDNIALRFALGKNAKIARGLVMGVGLAPYGYRFVRRMIRDRLVTEGVEIDPETAPVVQRIFREILANPLAAVCATLNAEGVAPPGRPSAMKSVVCCNCAPVWLRTGSTARSWRGVPSPLSGRL